MIIEDLKTLRPDIVEVIEATAKRRGQEKANARKHLISEICEAYVTAFKHGLCKDTYLELADVVICAISAGNRDWLECHIAKCDNIVSFLEEILCTPHGYILKAIEDWTKSEGIYEKLLQYVVFKVLMNEDRA